MEETAQRPEISELLAAWSGGDRQALDRLIPLVMEDLRSMARSFMARESPGHTLQPTALVNEAYVRLAGRRNVRLENRLQLFALLAETMRCILVDHARHKKSVRQGETGALEALPELPVRVDVDLVALDDALNDLASFAPRQSRVVTLSYFGGLNFDQIAAVLGISPVTVKRDLKAARIWLLRALRRDGGTGSTG